LTGDLYFTSHDAPAFSTKKYPNETPFWARTMSPNFTPGSQ
jgi:hypothetical protein